MKLWCPEGEGHVVEVKGSNPPAGERFCPTHHCPIFNKPAGGSKPGLKRTSRGESPAEKRARLDFNRKVMQWPCFFQRHREGHECIYPLDAHHLIPKQFIRVQFSELDEADLLEILFNPLIGAPLCRAAHNAVEQHSDYIYFEELSADLIAYLGGLPDFMLLKLEEESPHHPDHIAGNGAGVVSPQGTHGSPPLTASAVPGDDSPAGMASPSAGEPAREGAL